jgi:hypothetical protein
VNTGEARQLGERIEILLTVGQVEAAFDLLRPVLAGKMPFRLLDEIGWRAGRAAPERVDPFLERVAAERTIGGWVVIASSLHARLASDLPGAFQRCHAYIIFAGTWYATDSIAERLPGPALVTDFERALELLLPWCADQDPWIRRSVGVAVHLWAKRSRGRAQLLPRASALLDLLSPLFEERQADVVKGVGWGLKTLGRYYPDLVAAWLEAQAYRPHRVLIMHKATTYLPAESRRRLLKE